MRSAAALGARWPSIDYVYLTPVSHVRCSRGGPWFRPASSADRRGVEAADDDGSRAVHNFSAWAALAGHLAGRGRRA